MDGLAAQTFSSKAMFPFLIASRSLITLDSDVPILEEKSCLTVIPLSLKLMDLGMGLGYSLAQILGNTVLLSAPLPFLLAWIPVL